MRKNVKTDLFFDGIMPTIWRFSFAWCCVSLGIFLKSKTGTNGIIHALTSDKTDIILSNVNSFDGILIVSIIVSIPMLVIFPLAIAILKVLKQTHEKL